MAGQAHCGYGEFIGVTHPAVRSNQRSSFFPFLLPELPSLRAQNFNINMSIPNEALQKVVERSFRHHRLPIAC